MFEKHVLTWWSPSRLSCTTEQFSLMGTNLEHDIQLYSIQPWSDIHVCYADSCKSSLELLASVEMNEEWAIEI